MDYWGGGGGGKGYVGPLSNYWGGGPGPPLPTPMLTGQNKLDPMSITCIYIGAMLLHQS